MKHQIMEAEVCSEHHHHMNLHVPQISPDDLYQLLIFLKHSETLPDFVSCIPCQKVSYVFAILLTVFL